MARTSHPVRRTRRLIALAAATILLASACGSGDNTTTASPDTACSPGTGKVELSFWSWVPGIKAAVDLWNAKNPDVQVRVEETPQGNQGTYGKMFNALKAGQAPDLGQIEFDSLPGFRVQQGLKNISACPGVAQAKPKFVDWTWTQASVGGRRRVRDPPGHRPDGVVLPQGPLRRARCRGPQDLGRVRACR
jgi:multiple sugar transport system substrate-binding protein